MNKISKQMTKCNTGDILAEELIDSTGKVLVVKNTVINEFIKDKLLDLGIKEILIHEHQEQQEMYKNEFIIYGEGFRRDNYIDLLNAVKHILRKLTKGILNYKEIEAVTSEMFQYIKEPGYVIHFLNQVRDKDEYTYQHSVNVAFYAMLTARWLKLPEKMIRDIIQAALLHDIGKINIPSDILSKKGKLTDQEYEIIKEHPAIGYHMVQSNPCINKNIAEAILQHHERNDGSGYPAHLPEQQISLSAKIIAICDVFDAMTQNRVYKDRVTPFDSFQMFLTMGRSSFDLQVLTVFMKNISSNYIGNGIRLNNGKKGQIVYIPPQNILFPVIRVEAEYLDLSENTDIKILELM
jgi:putative nucleotidyltransferase with HDIG domain